ncbi:MAG TPA: hypothetical protein VG077_19010 [Verrucomicrobiae bacterium]|nr:hypothetical protein [Verrucomicrobiae bacterium]
MNGAEIIPRRFFCAGMPMQPAKQGSQSCLPVHGTFLSRVPKPGDWKVA